jgi:ATP-dependent DNA helicase RecQ
LKILQASGYIELTNEVNNPTRIMFIVNRDVLYSNDMKDRKCDTLLKLLLRTYTGLFVSFVGIDESFLCEKMSINREELYGYLSLLSRHKLIQLIPKIKTPYLIFTEPRLPISYIKLAKTAYKDKKIRFKNKIDYVKYYYSSDDKCRSVILTEYFGDDTSTNCGRCDVCIKKRRKYLSNSEEKDLKLRLINRISDEPIKLNTLVDSLSDSKEYVLNVISSLLEEEKVNYNSHGLLCVNEE